MRLLEVQVMRLEGEEGTGTLEQDLHAFFNAKEEDAALRHALLYRIKQKQLARSWLLVVRSRIGELMAELRAAATQPSRASQ